MNPTKSTLLLLTLLSQHSLAHDTTTVEEIVQKFQVSLEEAAATVEYLRQAGEIEIFEGKIILREPTTLDILIESGRVEQGSATPSAICVKE